ncbi:MAG TPA: enoyl-CoA hydratase/isomerase family protein [Acidimicrobiia bacterium]|nr:enoyl-CoA hydratase/isomerase family protein [Acidimicrobiia bacterium]
MAVDVIVHDRIATVTLNRPDAMNSIDPAMRSGLHAAWQRIASDDEIRVAIITGAGDRAFCAGADLKNTPPPAESHAALTFGDTRDHILHGLDTDKPLVCAINGHAVGAGLEIALACDIRIAATGAKFGLPEVKVGSVPGAGGTQLLPRTVGRSNAMQMLLTGELIDAETALRWGLVSEVHDLEALRDRARALAERIAANAPLSVRAVKRLASRGLDVPLPTGMEMERYVFGLLRDSEDRLEGRKAFQEKRPPEYRGR